MDVNETNGDRGEAIICIGSNYNRRENLPLARRELRTLFPTIRFAAEQDTEPLYFANPALFANQVAMFGTHLPKTALLRALKAIEQQAGRLPGDKQQERVCLDIDLLCYNGEVLKPRDLKRAYVVSGLKELQTESDI